MLDLQKVIADTKIRLCLDCGKCTVVCPVNRYDPTFNPRLIVQTALSQGNRGPVDDRIWACINCNMCTERCNYNVKFTEFVRVLRQRAIENGVEPQISHGGTPQAIMHMMAHKDIEQNRLSWLPQDVGIHKYCDTAFFVGCAPYFDVIFSDLDIHTVEGPKGALKLLNRARIPFILLPNERCCGHDLILQGDIDGFLALAQANMREFSKRGIKNIITHCPECHYTLNVDYPRFLENWNVNVRHITEITEPMIVEGKLALTKLEHKVTYHDPCTLGRYSRIFEQPRVILDSLVGLKKLEMADNRDKSLCCGATPWVHCGTVNKQIQKARLAQAEATGADILVTACPKCQIHLRCAQKSPEADDVSQIDIQDLCALAAGLLIPQEVN